MNKTTKRLLGILLLVSLSLQCLSFYPTRSFGQEDMFTPGRLVYAIHDWSSVENEVFDLSTTMKVNCPKHQVTEYYWGVQFVFKNGNIGWFGMTSSCMGVGGGGFIFTICDAISAEPSSEGYLSKNIEPGNGLSCVLPYEWNNGMEYRFTLTKNLPRTTSTRICWSLQAEEIPTSQFIHIGDIFTAPQWDQFYPWSSYFVEYFGPILDCKVMPRGTVTFHPLELTGQTNVPYSEIYITENCKNQTEVSFEKEEKIYIKTGSKY